MPVFRTGSYELIYLFVGVFFLYYQDSRYLMRLVEAVEEEHPLGRGQMFQHCCTKVGSPSSIRSLRLC